MSLTAHPFSCKSGSAALQRCSPLIWQKRPKTSRDCMSGNNSSDAQKHTHWRPTATHKSLRDQRGQHTSCDSPVGRMSYIRRLRKFSSTVIPFQIDAVMSLMSFPFLEFWLSSVLQMSVRDPFLLPKSPHCLYWPSRRCSERIESSAVPFQLGRIITRSKSPSTRPTIRRAQWKSAQAPFDEFWNYRYRMTRMTTIFSTNTTQLCSLILTTCSGKIRCRHCSGSTDVTLQEAPYSTNSKSRRSNFPPRRPLQHD